MLGLTGAASETLRRIVRESEQLWLTATDEEGPSAAALPSGFDVDALDWVEDGWGDEAAAEARAVAGEGASERRLAGDAGVVAMGDMHAQRR
jgi:hypothetical protein